MPLKNKRILFLSARTFGIPENITQTMEALGATVDFYDERPANSFIVKALIRINRNLIAGYINRYHKNNRGDQGQEIRLHLFHQGGNLSPGTISTFCSDCIRKPGPSCIIGIPSPTIPMPSICRGGSTVSFRSTVRIAKNGIFVSAALLFRRIQGGRNIPRSVRLRLSVRRHDPQRPFPVRLFHNRTNKSLRRKMLHLFFFQGKIMFYKYKFQNREMRGISSKAVHFVPLSKIPARFVSKKPNRHGRSAS